MLIIFLIVLVDLIGFGIMVPIFAFYALNLGADPSLATAMMAIYSGAMFLATPVLGRLRDRFGRKPVLALSLVGHYHANLGNREQALDYTRRASELAPDNMYVFYGAATALNALAESERAMAALARAVELGYPLRLVEVDAGLAQLRRLPGYDALGD